MVRFPAVRPLLAGILMLAAAWGVAPAAAAPRPPARAGAVRAAAAAAESLGTAAQQAGRWAASDSLFGVALDGWRALGEKRREAVALGSRGSTWFLAGDYARADSLYRAALEARRALGDSLLIGRALNTLGSIAYLRHRNTDALGWLLQAHAVRTAIDDRGGLAATCNSLGLVAVGLGQPDSARAWFGQALDLAVARGDSARAGEVLTNYANLLRAGGELERAEGLTVRAMAIAQARGDARNHARLHNGLGEILRLQGRFTEAAAAQAEAARLNAVANDVRGEMETLLSLGTTWLDLQDPARARPPLTRAVTLADSLGDANAGARGRNDLAIALRQAGDEREATRVAARGLELAAGAEDSLVVVTLATTLGLLASDRRAWREARGWFERAAGAARGRRLEDEASAFINLGYVATQEERTDDAGRAFRDALALAERADAQDRLWLAMLGMGDVAERRGDFPEALRWDRRAVTLIDTLRSRQQEEAGSITLFSNRLYAYEALIHLLGRLAARSPDSGYAAEGFQWAERARARAFLDRVRGAGGASVAPLTLEQARRLLDSDRVALLEYSLSDSSTSLWVITRKAWRLLSLPPRAALRARAELLRRGLGDPSSAESRATRGAARALYRTLIEPAEPLLGGVRHLIIAPDGPLARVPFEALLSRDVAGEDPAPRGSYLVERFDISYVPSATALATRAARAAQGGGLVALGDPRFAPDSAAAGSSPMPGVPALAPLPGTEGEVDALRSLAGRRPFESLTGPAATRGALLALPGLPAADVLHIATHGEANEVEPQRSGLWLAWEGGAPGFLSVRDILGLRLGADLVTLSACETGLGRVERGEGVLGLSRAFMAVGARSVVVSLWKVNDRSTTLLMERFYRPLLTKRMSREAALAGAKRVLLADARTRSPFYWAPFVLVGASGPLR